jgi:hypothetical protein
VEHPCTKHTPTPCPTNQSTLNGRTLMRTDDDPLDAEERYLVECIQRLQEEYTRVAKPYTDRLVRLRALRAPPRWLVTVEQAQAMGLVPRA